MRWIKSAAIPGRRQGPPGITIAFPLAKNPLHGAHSVFNGILEPSWARDGLALAAVTP